jgi:hypothetical protein
MACARFIAAASLWSCFAIALGCARSAEPSNVPDDEDLQTVAPPPDEPATDRDADDRDAEPGDPDAPADDDDAEHISFDGPDAEPAMPDQIVAPPTRPTMPSMMTDVLKTGPRPR